MSERKIYLAYGSNLNLKQMAQRCPTAKILGATTLKDYQLLFKGAFGNAHATIEPSKGSEVPVLLWGVTAEDEKRLDRYEGYPHYYVKETVKVKLGKKTVEAMVYIMNDGYKFNPPSVYYYETIREGYKDNNLPLSKLENAYHYTAGRMRMEHGLKD